MQTREPISKVCFRWGSAKKETMTWLRQVSRLTTKLVSTHVGECRTFIVIPPPLEADITVLL